ncbi:MAG: hypothetical protein HZC55_00850 [Verrucomicrobia bacterium]|nr:hypothetical protein [Verrucomicrobiota bacterium]
MNNVWKGYDDLSRNPSPDIDWNNEWSLNAHLGRRIRRLWPRASPFEFESSWPVMDKRVTPRSQPPTPDFSILSRDNRISASFDFDAKLIRQINDTKAYADKIAESFLTGRYSGGSRGGGMIAYVLPSDAKDFQTNIASVLKCELIAWPPMAPRLHFVSNHVRMRRQPPASANFALHHLLMGLRQASPV